MTDSLIDTAALERRDTACAELVAELNEDSDGAHAPGEIEAFCRDLFEKYFAASQQKQEPADTATPKIAKIVAKQARKKFGLGQAAAPAAAAPAEPAGPVGQVTGKTGGIDRKIMNILTEVSAHFDTPIAIISGLRTKPAQAQALYTNWHSHLRDGKDNDWLAKNEKLRLQLDELKQAKNKAGFVDLLTKKADWSALSRHMTGDEVDLAANTDPNIVAALASCLNHKAGRNSEGTRCHHFDNSKALWPIIDSVRERWST